MAVRQPVLIMIQGPEPGSFYKLPDNRVSTIGRSSRNSIRVVSPSVSRFHCEIVWVNGSWVLSDLNSRKGTIVNREPVADKRTLAAGDIIRLSSVVFRFDMMDETFEQDAALVAIREAELDQKLRLKGEATGSLDDIRARTRLASAAAREGRVGTSQVLRVDAAFLVGVAVLVALCAAGILAYASARQAPPGDARALYREAVSALEAGGMAQGLQLLERVAAEHRGTETAQMAARRREQAVWTMVEREFARVSDLEAGGDYAGALRVYEELARLGPTEAAEDTLNLRRQYTVRLAHAAFRAVEREAAGLLERGDRRAALELYSQAQARIGPAELAAQAGAKAAELQSLR